MKRPTYAQILALVAEMVEVIAEQPADAPGGGDYRDQLVGIVLRHIDSWAAKP
jgi:hypothetical protein